MNIPDRELLDAVTGLGEVRKPDQAADQVVDATMNPSEQPDLRGDRDRESGSS